jgi:hypothetical protein
VIDLTGQRFGRLLAISFAGYGANWNSKWRCICDCGNEATIYMNALRRGQTKSCGCLHRDICSRLSTTHGHTKRGQWSAEYRAWSCMLTRCENPNCKNYPNYGGRGIKVCEKWHSFEVFFGDMGERPSPRHSLDRWPDNDGDYEPGNCRWATRRQQGRNRTTNAYVVVQGERLVLAEACERYGISHSRVRSRIKAGWPVEKAVVTPTKKGNAA